MKTQYHNNVTEYDGAYWCLDCGEQWGALPGRPEEPKECKQLEGSEPAFPLHIPEGTIGPGCGPHIEWGISQRDFFCALLKVPNTGKPWLDELIREAKLEDSFAIATAMLAQKGDEK